MMTKVLHTQKEMIVSVKLSFHLILHIFYFDNQVKWP